MKRILQIITLAGLLVFTQSAFSQTGIASFLNAGVDDAEQLTNLYMEPFGKAFSTALTGGWYNTAAPHKLLGFDVTFSLNYVTYPKNSMEFDLKDHRWKMLDFDSTQSTKSPTISGDNSYGPWAGISTQVTQTFTTPFGDTSITMPFSDKSLFRLPKGVYPADLPVPAGVPLPMLNASIGLIKGTEIMGRYVPPISAIDAYGSFSLWGVGVKHDFKQWIPVVKLFPFDASIMAAYTKIYSSFNKINYYPTDVEGIVNELSAANNEANITKTQKLELSTSAFTTNLILSKKLLMFTVYGSVGFYTSNFDINLLGKYPVPGIKIDATNILNPQTRITLSDDGIIEDPLKISSKATDFRAGLGFRVKLLLATIHVDYTYQDYSMYTLGLGISFR